MIFCFLRLTFGQKHWVAKHEFSLLQNCWYFWKKRVFAKILPLFFWGGARIQAKKSSRTRPSRSMIDHRSWTIGDLVIGNRWSIINHRLSMLDDRWSKIDDRRSMTGHRCSMIDDRSSIIYRPSTRRLLWVPLGGHVVSKAWFFDFDGGYLGLPVGRSISRSIPLQILTSRLVL